MDPRVFDSSTETRKANLYLLFRVPLAFLLIASLLGLFLRYQQFNPQEGINYTFLLHGHSHVMFLGWIFNVLLLAFAIEFLEINWFRLLFWFLQGCVVGMLISFPLQGYGIFSIVFSSLHTFGTFAFAVLFFRGTTAQWTLPLMLAKAALLFLMLSSLGPFALAYLKSQGLDHSNLYRFAIYFYLHFQYNGFFLFGILSLIAKLSEGTLQPTEQRRLKIACFTLITACAPAYLLSILWSKPPFYFNIIGIAAGTAQLAALYMIWTPLKQFIIRQKFAGNKILLSMSFAALSFKFLLQVISGFPMAAEFANEFRHVVIAYLHLVLVGFTTFFLIGWLINKKVIPLATFWEIGILLAGFIGSEVLLAASPWSESIFNLATVQLLKAVFLLSLLMVGGIVCMLIPFKINYFITRTLLFKVLLPIFEPSSDEIVKTVQSEKDRRVTTLLQRKNLMNKAQTVISPAGIIFNTISVFFGLLALAIGVINTFWGNDPGFGIFIIVLSAAFFPPITAMVKEKTGRRIPGFMKVLLALFILWASLGVGELPDKIGMMIMDLRE